MAVEQFAAALEALLQAMGFSGRRQRQLQRRRPQRTRKDLQCYNCQPLGHTARECTNAVACLKCAAAHDTRCCTKPRGVAGSCANCGGSHAANSRSCGYLRETRRLLAAPRPAVTPRASTAAPPPRFGGGCEPRRREAATDDALAGFQAAFAAERAALKEELAAVHRQLQQLRDELRVLKKKPPVPAAAPAVSRPVGVDVATQTAAAPPPAALREEAPMDTEDEPPGQPPSKVAAASEGAKAPPESSPAETPTPTSAAPPPAAMQEEAPMDTEDVPPGLPPSKVAAASKGAPAPPASSHAEKPMKKRRISLPFPDVRNVQVILKNTAAALQSGSYPYSDHPYPFTPPDQPIPPLPHRPLHLRTYRGRDMLMEAITRKELALLNSHPIFTPSQWDDLVTIISLWVNEEYRSGRRKMDADTLEAKDDIARQRRQFQ
ncbi:uncharacterized protein LOC126204335 [Schistocerca nitens]|uniref:uncharacterized protein LOC126204335 n=1 Tax=Schistocerca nitens TaxID=7011 RepID=UPI002117FF0C|nr:uncharacterized protein LOC126204335 [Schistocerca nitens]